MADTKISALTAASVAAVANELAINEAGVSKKITVGQLQTLISQAGASYATGSFTAATGTFALMVNHLTLTSTQRVTLAGTARLRII